MSESVYADLRDSRDGIEIALASGRIGNADATPVAAVMVDHNALRTELSGRLAGIDSGSLGSADARALGIMRGALRGDLDSLAAPSLAAVSTTRPDCSYDPRRIAEGPGGLDSLRTRIYACYGWAQSHLPVNGDTLDRLSILGRLGREENAESRKQLFLSLQPVWRAVNAQSGTSSPYRVLMASQVRSKPAPGTELAKQALNSGVPPDSVEPWLLSILATWRKANPDTTIEPWDWYFVTGKASRMLSPRLSRERIVALNASVFRSLGAPVDSLRVQYDLDPREGKTPVAFTTFGERPRFINGTWRPGKPWVFATYRTGGLDNLNELLHETGHAVHIAAIRTRPAFTDWPDSDPFTEAVADLHALDVYEPLWQQRWLGDSVPLTDGLRGRYGGIVLDIAWALFELRMLRNPGADPNLVWTELTQDYLRIRPHPEISWWAMRGQLIDSPGYMMNYAVGAMLAAAIRACIRERRGPAADDSGWYRWVAPRLFRFGLERPTSVVLTEFLGGPVSPAPLLDDIARLHRP